MDTSLKSSPTRFVEVYARSLYLLAQTALRERSAWHHASSSFGTGIPLDTIPASSSFRAASGTRMPMMISLARSRPVRSPP